MRKMRILLAAAALSVATAGLTATPAHACLGEVCDAINYVCAKTITKGHACVK